MHAGFARWLERVGEGRDEYASLLAHHYAEAVRPEDADLAWAGAEQELERLRAEAVEWLARAGELAIARYELGEGIALLERATELEPDARRRADLWREIGRANALNFDGPAFWTAMERSLEMSADRETRGDTYSLLAFHTSTRSGMWKRRPDPQVVDGWVEQALELTPPDSAARVRALIARANWRPEYGEESAREASAIADRLGLPELRSWAWEARAVAAFHDGRYDDAFRWARRRFDLHEEISDPDHLAEMRESAIPTSNAFGRFGEARRLAGEHDDLARGLSTHHRMHSVALAVEIAEAAGDWDDIRGLEKRVEQAVAANTDTPCVRNQRSLLVCATARVHAGDERRARELERVAEEIAMEGYPAALAGPRLRLALARRDLDHVEHLVADPQERQNFNFGIAAIAAWLDALGALRDRGTAEERAPAFVQPRFYLEPFALRALGIVRDDRELIARAQERFAALKLDWHASQTETLRNFRT